ncbi:unnamed protein product [Ceratitis capitata]|uniref:(Mediterranean fruit fly) hypothetical protein n=1 Tax=Ceratitis capitata TaxID=7213 RepID=A0A811V1K7_CERCA|nr:unnamed protein product [Ceratitis capitata]
MLLPHTILLTLLLCCQELTTAWATRLPLEVYELTAAAAAASNAADDGSTNNYTRHRNLEYATVDAKMLQHATAAAAAVTAATRTTTKSTIQSQAAIATDLPAGVPSQQQQEQETSDLHADHRRSRQMLEIIEQQQREHQLQQQQQQLQQQHKYHRESLLQQQHQQLKLSKATNPYATYEKDNNSYNRQRHGSGGERRIGGVQDVRILYQVGLELFTVFNTQQAWADGPTGRQQATSNKQQTNKQSKNASQQQHTRMYINIEFADLPIDAG